MFSIARRFASRKVLISCPKFSASSYNYHRGSFRVRCFASIAGQLGSYTVGWICAIPTEYVVACELLDEEYSADQVPRIDTQRDSNLYTFGRIYEHNVVIACLPKGRYGITSAALVAERMRASFPALRFGLLVGIAGGAPSKKHDIRLGDVVVSSPTPRHGGVI